MSVGKLCCHRSGPGSCNSHGYNGDCDKASFECTGIVVLGGPRVKSSRGSVPRPRARQTMVYSGEVASGPEGGAALSSFSTATCSTRTWDWCTPDRQTWQLSRPSVGVLCPASPLSRCVLQPQRARHGGAEDGRVSVSLRSPLAQYQRQEHNLRREDEVDPEVGRKGSLADVDGVPACWQVRHAQYLSHRHPAHRCAGPQ